MVASAASISIVPAALFRRHMTIYASNLYSKWLLTEIIAFVRRRKFPLADASDAFRLADSATTGEIVFASN